MKQIFIGWLLLVLTGCISSPLITTETTESNPLITLPIGLSYPPISTSSGLAFTVQQMEALNINLVRIGTNWVNREPEPGTYSWAALDDRINTLYESGASILLTIPASGPDWVCNKTTNKGTCVFTDDSAFRSYVAALMTRYHGKIDKLQFGNEWDNLDWYPGTAEDFVRTTNILYAVVKEVSPETDVVLGGLTSTYPLFITVCKNGEQLSFSTIDLKPGKDPMQKIEHQICSREDLISRVEHVFAYANYDLVDLHLYDISEYWPQAVAVVKNLSDKPLIISEFGGPSPDYERYSQIYHARRLEQYLLTLNKLPIEEAYYFNLVDNLSTYHNRSGLFTILHSKKKAFYTMQNMLGWEE